MFRKTASQVGKPLKKILYCKTPTHFFYYIVTLLLEMHLKETSFKTARRGYTDCVR